MNRLSISEILEKADKEEDVKKKIEILYKHDSVVLREILKYCYDKNIKFLLPEGPAPYTPSKSHENHKVLYANAKKLYLFVEGGNNSLVQSKREKLFIMFLEGLHHKDAELIVSVKDKKLPYKSIDEKLVRKAYPGLLT
jgi:hypothetical protein